MLTRKGKYGLKAMLTLAREHGTGPMLIGDLAEHDAIPKKFLENILLTLKHRGLVQSRKGPHGGYQLGRPPDRISVGDVIRDGGRTRLSTARRTRQLRQFREVRRGSTGSGAGCSAQGPGGSDGCAGPARAGAAAH